jgi:hypothetical protein
MIGNERLVITQKRKISSLSQPPPRPGLSGILQEHDEPQPREKKKGDTSYSAGGGANVVGVSRDP